MEHGKNPSFGKIRAIHTSQTVFLVTSIPVSQQPTKEYHWERLWSACQTADPACREQPTIRDPPQSAHLAFNRKTDSWPMGSGAVCFRDPTETSGGKAFDQIKHPPRLVSWAWVCVWTYTYSKQFGACFRITDTQTEVMSSHGLG